MFMSAVEFLSDYSYKSVFSCKPRTPKAALQNETVRTKQMSYLFTCANITPNVHLELAFLLANANE